MFLKKHFFVVFLVLTLVGVFNIFSDERTKNIQSIVLQDFEFKRDSSGKETTEPSTYWVAIPNRFGREGNSPTGKSLEKLAWVNAWPEAYFGKEGVYDDGSGLKEYKHCLGLFVKFNRQGYNFVELYPVKKLDDGTFEKKMLPFRGIVQSVDLWVWAANYNYEMEVVFVDYRDVEYRLEVGRIKHIGWKQFTIPIPTYIPQSTTYIPRTKVLSLKKIVLWTSPSEKVSGSYIYIDHIKYLTDIFESKYDGYNLGEPKKVEDLWKEGVDTPDDTNVKP